MKEQNKKDSSSLGSSSGYSEESFLHKCFMSYTVYWCGAIKTCPNGNVLTMMFQNDKCSVALKRESRIYSWAKNEGYSLANSSPFLLINRANSCSTSHFFACTLTICKGKRGGPGSSGKHRHHLEASLVNPLTATSGTWAWCNLPNSCETTAQTFAESGPA